MWSLSLFGVPCQQPEGFLWQTMEVLPSGTPLIHITVVIYHHYFYNNKKKVIIYNTLKTSTCSLFRIQWRQTTKVWLLKGGLLSVFHKRESLPETLNFRNLLQVTRTIITSPNTLYCGGEPEQHWAYWFYYNYTFSKWHWSWAEGSHLDSECVKILH